MLKSWFRFTVFLPLLIGFLLPTDGTLQNERDTIFEPKLDSADAVPCSELDITHTGVSCLSPSNTQLELDFPQVDLESVLAGNEFLPQAEKIFQLGGIVTADEQYRNITLSLRWEPVTPDFLQIYLKEDLPYWGHRVPYRLFWSINYELCSRGDCTEWARFEQKGEVLPSDIPDLPSDLAADSNFNGVPASFWNTHVTP